MKTVSICVGILLSLLLLANFCYAEKNVAQFQPSQGSDIAKNGEEIQEQKFKFLPHHIPSYKKPFFKPIPYHPIVKKPIPYHPIFKKPSPKPHYPPVFPSHP